MLKTLRRIIQEVSSAEDFQDALDVLVSCVAKVLQTEACTFFLLDRRRGEYVLLATIGLNPAFIKKIRIPMNQGLVGLIGEREEPINLDDATKHPRYLRIPEMPEEQYKAFLGIPITYHRQVLAILVVQKREAKHFAESDEAFLVTLAAQMASVIAHAEATGAVAKLLPLLLKTAT